MSAVKKKAAAKKAPAKKTAKTGPVKQAAKKAPAKKTAAKKAQPSSAGAPKKHRIYGMSFASIYPLYIQKVERKGRTKSELDEVIAWLTGYEGPSLQRVLETRIDLETFFNEARMNPKASLITGVVCGVRLEELTDPLMRNIRYLDKLVDELARGKKMSSILRE